MAADIGELFDQAVEEAAARGAEGVHEKDGAHSLIRMVGPNMRLAMLCNNLHGRRRMAALAIPKFLENRLFGRAQFWLRFSRAAASFLFASFGLRPLFAGHWSPHSRATPEDCE